MPHRAPWQGRHAKSTDLSITASVADAVVKARHALGGIRAKEVTEETLDDGAVVLHGLTGRSLRSWGEEVRVSIRSRAEG